MAVDEVRVRLRRKLEEAFGVDEAAVLMDQSLDLKLEALEQRLRNEMAGLRVELHKELRSQTWRLSVLVITSFGLFAALVRFG